MRLSLLLLLLFLSPAARADAPAPDCPSRFAQLLGLRHVAFTRPNYRVELARLENITVKDIFPDAVTRRGKKIIKMTPENKQNYYDQFDALWDTRVKEGLIPSNEVSAYRKWLKEKHAGNPHPLLDSVTTTELYNDFVITEPPGKLAAHFDEKFLDYLEESKRVTADTVADYVATVDTRFLSRVGMAAYARLKTAGSVALTAAVTAAFMQFYTIPSDFTVSAINGLSQALFGQTVKDYFNNTAKTVSTSAGQTLRDWKNSFDGGEEKYVETVLSLVTASARLEAKNFNAMPRSEAKDALDKFMDSTSTKLPLFAKLVASEQPNFESSWDKRLQELKQSMIVENSVYQQHKIALDQLKATIDGKNPPEAASPEELSQMADYTAEMENAENFLAAALADWLFYAQARGKDKPIEEALDLNFRTVYASYMRTMSPAKLAMAVNARVKAHTAQLAKYSNKVTGTNLQTGTPDDKKPEDMIKIENPVKPKPVYIPGITR